ncbi:MAG: hypothetical protein ABIX01_14065 [Chitinophagaceae bacterium]
MTGNYDDMMRSKLNNHESKVPDHLFDHLRNRMDAEDQIFDADVAAHTFNFASPVPANLFDEINDRLDLDNIAFDSAIRNSLTKSESPVPAGMWNRIIREKDRRRPLAWWWAAAVLFLFIGGCCLYYYQHQQGKELTVAGVQNGHKTITKPSGTETENSGLPTPASNNTRTDNELAATLPSIPTDNSVQSFSYNKRGENKDAFYPPDRANRIAAGAKNNALKGSQKNDLLGKEGQNGEADELILHKGTENNISGKMNLDGSTDASYIQYALRQLIRSLASKKVVPLQLLEANRKNPEIPCPLNGDEPRNDWYLDAYTSPMVVFKKLTDKIPGKNVQSGMDSTLHKQISFNAGINLVKNIGAHFLVKAGIQYNQVNELFRHTRVNEIKLITTVTIRTVILSPGDTIYIRDTSVIQQIGTAVKQTQNRYKSWDLPLILGFEFGGKDLRLNANIGIIGNINSRYQGDMLDTTQQIINIANYKTAGVYKTNIGLGVYAGLSVVKAIGDKMDLLVEPHARFNLGNTTTDAAWFNQKNIIPGLSVGVRYKLNGRRQR